MPLNEIRARELLAAGELSKLFIEELGWDRHSATLDITIQDATYQLQALAQKRGMVAYQCVTPIGKRIPQYDRRRKIEHQVARSTHEHLIVFSDAANDTQIWQWVKREVGKPAACREHIFYRSQSGDALLQKLKSIAFTLDEEEQLTLVDVAGRTRAGFDVEKITKRFYDRFQKEHTAYLEFIKGITDKADHEWYASVMLNRLMFVYFIQRKGFLDGDSDYLRNRLKRMREEHGKDKFYSFYRYFLLRLFHEGLGGRKRSAELEKLIGRIPYLNGGLFDVHELERPDRYGKNIQISDEAFERIFDYFDQYQWHLDERPLRADNEINPDVLGYIFEKYINQKQMGAYYTKEDITEYISKYTVLPFLFDEAQTKCRVAFDNPKGSTIWDLLKEAPDRYIYPAVRHGLTWDYRLDHHQNGVPISKPFDLPEDITVGLNPSSLHQIVGDGPVCTLELRTGWNKPAPSTHALPTETWREVIARRNRYQEVKAKLAAGEIRNVNDLITFNLDIRQFAQDVIEDCEGPDLLRAFWHAIEKVTILDPTCGSGAFLFAALNILEPLYEACLDRMEAFINDDDRLRPKSTEESIRELIESGESQFLEFKATARWNLKECKADKGIEQVITKTVAAFLNSSGGDLLIGVKDDGSILGIEADLQLFSVDKRNRDAYENWLTTLLLGVCGKQHTSNIRVSFARLGMMDVCRITVFPAPTAVYVKENNDDAFYVRAGNSTRRLNLSEVVAYHQQRFSQPHKPLRLVEPPKPTNPKKFADFRKILDTVAAHPNRRYFIFKSIILNNLYGVDIMEEAVEICKLRLFLKLAAQVSPEIGKHNLGVEPLPDIDFNIRAGNTLVGYATYDEVKGAVTSGLDFDNAMERISVKAADLQQTFDKFRHLQTEGDGSVPHADKLELQKRLKALADELNRHLADACRVKVSDKAAYCNWVKSHQPFHWFIQFYGILHGGGFDVIIGNPPYVELSKIREYSIRNLRTTVCGNLYCPMVERFAALGARTFRLGVIVPLSLSCTERMSEVRETLASRLGHTWVSHFSGDANPSKLFEGVKLRLDILLGVGGPRFSLWSSQYLKWFADARPCLFPSIAYEQAPEQLWHLNLFPKLGTQLAQSVMGKLLKKPPLAKFTSSSGKPIYVHRVITMFVKCFDSIPYFRNETDGVKKSDDYKPYLFSPSEQAETAMAVLNSSTFFFYFIALGDCFHCGKEFVLRFPFDIEAEQKRSGNKLASIAQRLMRDLKKNAVRKRALSEKTGVVEYDEFWPSKSKPILDEIDAVLARHYGFTAEELDFILNYDIKYRLGRDAEGDEE